jgi:plasmid stabilization system protein ParE
MGKKVALQVKWNVKALHNFINILDFIKLDSPTNAKRVKIRVNNIINSIPSNPEMFREDELKENNDATYRVFTKDRIRISYKIEPKDILIARVVHSSQEPNNY